MLVRWRNLSVFFSPFTGAEPLWTREEKKQLTFCMELSLKALWQPIIQLETVNSACDFPQDTVGMFVFDGPTTHTLWPIRMCLLLERKTGCLEIMLKVSLHEIGDALDVLTNCVSICQLVSLFVTGLTVLKLSASSLYISSPRFLKKKQKKNL